MKPVPPGDLWDSLDKVVAESGGLKPPSESFTSEDVQKRYGIDRNRAYLRLRKLLESGKIISLGRFGNKTYYQLVKS